MKQGDEQGGLRGGITTTVFVIGTHRPGEELLSHLLARELGGGGLGVSVLRQTPSDACSLATACAGRR